MSHFNAFMRSSAAAYRRSEREQQRKAREAARQFKAQAKLDAISDAARAVKNYNNYISILKSVHKEATEEINWETVLDDEPPASPNRQDEGETKALYQQSNYRPSFFDKLFGSESKKRKKLQQDVETARAKDEKVYQNQLKQYEQDKQDFYHLQEVAKGVLNKQVESYKDALLFFEPYSDIAELGTKVELSFQPEHVSIELKVNNKEVIPDYVLSQTSTGKLSKKTMTAGKINDLYQDYVCSCLLRVARETLAYLPVHYVVVNAVGVLFDSITGYEDAKTIVSVIITPDKLKQLNMNTIDPSDSMKNFHHRMRFSKTNGFSAVERIDGKALML
ncbi:hypothetical protein [Filimonas effusa]|uniref:Uncharacterized protein n=1 Tax=Filimonas effusa TaxID=2508721 RepID=A0A4V1MAR2_9BACT|nr:hypothetical protein [Filimonas effusa]RXK86766.1 hypothetical protein ESB13_08200 [Filimonas effusa]